METSDIDKNVQILIDCAGMIKTEFKRLDEKRIKQAAINVNTAMTKMKKILMQIRKNTKEIRQTIPKQQRSNTKQT